MISEVHNCSYQEGKNIFQPKQFDLVFDDKPYNIKADKFPYLKDRIRPVKQKNGQVLYTKGMVYEAEWDKKPITSDYWSYVESISKNQILFDKHDSDFGNLGPGRLKWIKRLTSQGLSFKDHEMAYCSMVEDTFELQYLWNGFQQGCSIETPMVPFGDKSKNEKRIHPTQKPVRMYVIALKQFAQPGWTVLDNFAGSQSLRIACHILGLNYIGFEIDKKMYLKGCERFKRECEYNLFYTL